MSQIGQISSVTLITGFLHEIITLWNYYLFLSLDQSEKLNSPWKVRDGSEILSYWITIGHEYISGSRESKWVILNLRDICINIPVYAEILAHFRDQRTDLTRCKTPISYPGYPVWDHLIRFSCPVVYSVTWWQKESYDPDIDGSFKSESDKPEVFPISHRIRLEVSFDGLHAFVQDNCDKIYAHMIIASRPSLNLSFIPIKVWFIPYGPIMGHKLWAIWIISYDSYDMATKIQLTYQQRCILRRLMVQVNFSFVVVQMIRKWFLKYFLNFHNFNDRLVPMIFIIAYDQAKMDFFQDARKYLII